ncbi:TPA: FHIPEP family type III secretion protein, partial [Candidatus Scatousia excrementigallinarum]|nr:FHIPEP family type III secretion protein [Candidatus Scatousia excrementigallinarum]
MFKSNKMQYIIRSCSSENVQELQNLLNEMSMNGWELYSMNEVETDDGFKYNCIFMSELKNEREEDNGDIINISSFKSQMEKMLSPKQTPYEDCVDIQLKIKSQQDKISKIKTELEKEAPASVGRKKLNDKISAGLKELDSLKADLARATSPDVMYSRLQEEKLSINLSEELLGYVDNESDIQEEALLSATVHSRLKLTDELGYVIPKIIFKDDETLNPYEFSIKVRGSEAIRALVYPNYSMFFEDEIHLEKKMKNSIYDTDAVSGRKIVWLERSQTKDFWEKGLSGAEYIARVLEFVAVKYVDELLDYADVDKYIDVVSENNSYLVENVIPDFISLSDLRFILTSMIRERVSVKDITHLFERINDFAEDCPKSELLKKLRLSFSRQICRKYLNQDGVIPVFEVSEKTLDAFVPSFEEDDDFIIKIDGDFAEKLAEKIMKKAKQYDVTSIKLLVPMEFRHLFFTLLSNYIN